MTTFSKHHSDLYYRGLAALAMIGPMLLVIAAGALPDGLERGELIVGGYEVLFAVLVTAVILRTVYAVGFSKALKIAASVSNYSVTA